MTNDTGKEILQSSWKISLNEEYANFPLLKRNDVEKVLQWCTDQPHLPPVSEHTAALFLVLSFYDIETAETYIENHYTFRTYYRSIFTNRDPTSKELCQAMDTINCCMLEGVDHDKRRVLFASLKHTDSSKFQVNEAVKLVYMTLEKDILQNGFSANGYTVFFDALGFGFGHFSTITITFLKELFSYFLDGANVAINEIHVINVNTIVEKLVAIIRRITPKSFHERIKLYTKEKNYIYLDKFPKDVLFEELGGLGKSLKELCDINQGESIKLRDWFLADEKYLRVNESKRPKNKQNKKVIKLQTLSNLELD